MTNKNKVILGMSGGTDSSVTAMLLQEQGYEVIGVTFVFCDGAEHHLEDAQNLAARLGIKHIVYEAKDVFNSKIINYFVSEYMSGRTPVPCVLCNNYLKWPLLMQIADKEGAYYISTGHYIQTIEKDNKIFISSGTDPDKDQSFFMWGLPTEIMKRMLLPLGNKTKAEVREYAEKKGFKRVSVKKDSLGVCFCPGDYRDFLRDKEECKNITEGNFVDINGKYMGKHKGYPFYTVGQRRALGINLQQAHFVKEILPEKNIIILATDKDMYKTSFKIKDIVFNYPEITSQVLNCRIRYRKQNTPCNVVLLDNNTAEVILHEPLNAIAPGQAAAFYIDNFVVGGGIIVGDNE